MPLLQHPDPASRWFAPLQAVLSSDGPVTGAFVYDVQAKLALYRAGNLSSTAGCLAFPLHSASHSTLEAVHDWAGEHNQFADVTRVLEGSSDISVLFGAPAAVLSAIPDTSLVLVVTGNQALVQSAPAAAPSAAGAERIAPSLRPAIQLVWQRIRVSFPGPAAVPPAPQQQQDDEEVSDPIEQLQAFLELIGGSQVERCDTPTPPAAPRGPSGPSHRFARRLRSVSELQR